MAWKNYMGGVDWSRDDGREVGPVRDWNRIVRGLV